MKVPERIGFSLAIFALLAAIVIALHCSVDDPLLRSRWNWRRTVTFRPTTPSLSSDGRFLLFDSAREGQAAIYRLDRAPMNCVRLTGLDQLEFHPVLSHDASRVGFARVTGGYQHIWMMNSDGGGPTQITHGPVLDYLKCFSSDGSGLYFVRTSWQKRGLVPRRELFEVQLTGPKAGRVSRIGEACSISPDEKLLLSVESPSGEGSEIWSMRRGGTERRRLASGVSPSFSPDGRRIVYLRSRADYETEVMIMNADGSSPERVASPRGIKTEPEFCLGGQAIVFRIERSERFDTYGTYLISLVTRAVERLGETDAK